jgi:hypothetical protein
MESLTGVWRGQHEDGEVNRRMERLTGEWRG